jgi:hypothetical protein
MFLENSILQKAYILLALSVLFQNMYKAYILMVKVRVTVELKERPSPPQRTDFVTNRLHNDIIIIINYRQDCLY